MDKSTTKFINGDLTLGIEYDFKSIIQDTWRVIKKVTGKNSDSVYMASPPLDQCRWLVEMSERSVGKTTFYLIMGLIMHKKYGTKIEYIRNSKEEVAPSNASELWKTVLEFNYISLIFEDEYNDIAYHFKGWYLCKKNGGDIEKVSDVEVCHMHNLTTGVNSTKSTYNSPRGDLILYDEFIPVSGVTTENNWIALCQLLSTITRLRLSSRFILLANTINQYTHIFHELEITKELAKMHTGEERVIISDKGVPVWVHMIKFNETISRKRRDINMLKFGFKNPRLSSIIGGSDWEVKNYPHLYRPQEGEEIEKLDIFIRIRYYGHSVRVQICRSSILGFYALCWEEYTQPVIKDTSNLVEYILDIPRHEYQRYKLGSSENRLNKLIYNLYQNNRFFYSYNDVGTIVENFFKECKKGDV